MKKLVAIVLCLVLVMGICYVAMANNTTINFSKNDVVPMLKLTSPAFNNGDLIPDKYAEGGAVSPPLEWQFVPKGTKSFALAITDPDVPAYFNFPRNFAHWMIYDIPETATSLDEGISPGGTLPEEIMEAKTDAQLFGLAPGYFGPWPPTTETHRYVFTLYALKVDVGELGLSEESTYDEFVSKVVPQTISSATLIGLYGPAKTEMFGD